LDDDVLDRKLELVAEAAHEVAPKPARPLPREGRDDDLVDPLVRDSLTGGRERVGVRHLAVRVDAAPAELGERAAQASLCLGMARLRGIALRADEQEAGRRPSRPLSNPGEQRRTDDRLVRDHEDVRARALFASEVDDDVLDRNAPGSVADPVDDAPPEP